MIIRALLAVGAQSLPAISAARTCVRRATFISDERGARIRIDEDRTGLAVPPRRLVAMRASRPAARSPLPLRQARAAPLDPLAPGVRFLRRFDPADPLVAGQRRDVVPGRKRLRAELQRRFEI